MNLVIFTHVVVFAFCIISLADDTRIPVRFMYCTTNLRVFTTVVIHFILHFTTFKSRIILFFTFRYYPRICSLMWREGSI